MYEPIKWILIGLLILLVLREIFCWYCKTTDILKEQEKQTRILEEILYAINPNTAYFEEDKDEESTP